MRSARPLLAAVVALLLLATGCAATPAPPPASGSPSADPGAFPVTIGHAFGSTTIESAPERVVAWGWGAADAAIALGVTPVAIPFQAYGGDADGVLPWIRQALTDRGESVPTVLPDSEEPPYEAIAAADPDVILAQYSGLTDEQYDLLSAIAPVVAYPTTAWSTPWRDVIRIAGDALGRADEAERVLADIDARVAQQASAHPEFTGRTIAAVWDIAGTFYVYRPDDPRVELLLDLGFTSAPAVDDLANGDSTFYYTLSYEQLPALTSDVLLQYADTPEAAQAFLSSAPGRTMAQVQEGRVASLVGTQFIAAVSPPTALSATWGLDELVSALEGAVPA